MSLKFKTCSYPDCSNGEIRTSGLCSKHDEEFDAQLKLYKDSLIQKFMQGGVVRECGIIQEVTYNIAWNIPDGMYGFICRLTVPKDLIKNQEAFDNIRCNVTHGNSEELKLLLGEMEEFKLDTVTNMVTYCNKEMLYDDMTYSNANECWESFMQYVKDIINSIMTEAKNDYRGKRLTDRISTPLIFQ